MITLLKKIFGISPSVNIQDWIEQGAVVVDVRSKAEFQSGNIKGSVNIPLENISGQLKKLPKDKPILTCCASGMRSASAKHILKANGFKQVHNAGSWMSLRKYYR